jgi:CheY-like chemotaxis protein
MVALLLICTLIVFITVDVLVRFYAQKRQEKKLFVEREKALDIGLRLEFTDEAKSLKRVAVEEPRAKILAVDDEPIVLDSFRKILVLAGYSVDTVETGKEAIGLIQKNDYDFVFTDLKMPEMDGLDVTKAVKHLRPDIDVIMITGYATIESAVDAMKYGAMNYVQKPFTGDELVEFVNASLHRRQDRIERQMRPKVHLVTYRTGAEQSKHVFNVPAGLFISREHVWLCVEMTGVVRLGLDDFAQKMIGEVKSISLPKFKTKVKKGEPLFTVRINSHSLTFPSPVSGEVTSVNTKLAEHPGMINLKPYESGWVCCVDAATLTKDLQDLMIGADAVSWYQDEFDKLQENIGQLEKVGGNGKETKDGGHSEEVISAAFSKSFLHA